MESLSFDEIELILLYTNWTDILSFSKTNKRYKYLLDNKYFWYNKYKYDYNFNIKYELFNTDPFKKYINLQNKLLLKFIKCIIQSIDILGNINMDSIIDNWIECL